MSNPIRGGFFSSDQIDVGTQGIEVFRSRDVSLVRMLPLNLVGKQELLFDWQLGNPFPQIHDLGSFVHGVSSGAILSIPDGRYGVCRSTRARLRLAANRSDIAFAVLLALVFDSRLIDQTSRLPKPRMPTTAAAAHSTAEPAIRSHSELGLYCPMSTNFKRLNSRSGDGYDSGKSVSKKPAP